MQMIQRQLPALGGEERVGGEPGGELVAVRRLMTSINLPSEPRSGVPEVHRHGGFICLLRQESRLLLDVSVVINRRLSEDNLWPSADQSELDSPEGCDLWGWGREGWGDCGGFGALPLTVA